MPVFLSPGTFGDYRIPLYEAGETVTVVDGLGNTVLVGEVESAYYDFFEPMFYYISDFQGRCSIHKERNLRRPAPLEMLAFC